MKRTPDAAVTSLPRAPRDEAQGRVRHYIITMSIRVVCFALMFFVQPVGWWTWVFGIAAAVLPYIAVVVANAGISTPGTIDTLDDEQWTRMREINLDGLIRLGPDLGLGARLRRLMRLFSSENHVVSPLNTWLPPVEP